MIAYSCDDRRQRGNKRIPELRPKEELLILLVPAGRGGSKCELERVAVVGQLPIESNEGSASMIVVPDLKKFAR